MSFWNESLRKHAERSVQFKFMRAHYNAALWHAQMIPDILILVHSYNEDKVVCGRFSDKREFFEKDDFNQELDYE